MERITNPIDIRIDWCRRQIARARTEPEVEGWQAEQDGLRDALLNRDHTKDYLLCPPEIRQRYVLGLQDGLALLRTARIERTRDAAKVSSPTLRTEWGNQSGDQQ